MGMGTLLQGVGNLEEIRYHHPVSQTHTHTIPIHNRDRPSIVSALVFGEDRRDGTADGISYYHISLDESDGGNLVMRFR